MGEARDLAVEFAAAGGDTAMTDLADKLADSVEALSTGGSFVPRWQLPHDHDLRDIHAILERVIRSQHRLRAVRILPMPEKP